MINTIIMPKSGMAMEEGTIVTWLKNEGDYVKQGEAVTVIETDKVTMELESDYEGYILKIVKFEGEIVPVTEIIAYIGDKDETINIDPVIPNPEEKKNLIETTINSSKDLNKNIIIPHDKIPATPAAKRIAKENSIDIKKVFESGKDDIVKVKDVINFMQIKTTPLAKKIADDLDIDLSEIKGSGYNGRIFKEDLNINENHEANVLSDDKRDFYIQLTNLQKITGKRMFQSHTEIPSVTINAKADITELSEIRERLNKIQDEKITYNDFILKAAAIALKENPRVNSFLDGVQLLCKTNINIGMAVATKNGLIVPVIKNIDSLSIKEISKKSKEISLKAREGKINPSNLEDGTFTISNIGMYGITSFTPIINQPQSSILGVCTIEDEIKMVDSNIVNMKTIGLSLTFDHRILDGAEACIFLKKIKDLLEFPLNILI